MISEDKKRSFSAVMDQLRAKYLAGLAGKADELAQIHAAARAGEPVVAELAMQIHRLAGTAGSFGVHEVSDRATALDIHLHNGIAYTELIDDITALIQAMRDHSTNTVG